MADITIRIGNETRTVSDASENWINQQITRRKADGLNICVEVSIHGSGVDMRLATPGCGHGGGGGRPPNSNERQLFKLWAERGLNSTDFAGGNLVAFLKQLVKSFG